MAVRVPSRASPRSGGTPLRKECSSRSTSFTSFFMSASVYFPSVSSINLPIASIASLALTIASANERLAGTAIASRARNAHNVHVIMQRRVDNACECTVELAHAMCILGASECDECVSLKCIFVHFCAS